MPEFQQIPNKTDIENNHQRIRPYLHTTPVLTSEIINKTVGAELFFKCENFQKSGSFKFRGAITAGLLLNNSEKKRGVATHSSGNHGQALAKAAHILGIKAYIVMPENAPKVKVAAVKEYGAEVIFCPPTLTDRETTLEKTVDKTGATIVHPYNNYSVILGQSTCAKEFLQQTKTLDYILPPIGGGGLCSGTLLAAKNFSSQTMVVGTEPKNADDAYQSWKTNQLVPQTNPNTIADGLRTSLGDKTFPIIQSNIHQILTVEEESIQKALKLIWERMKLVVEPSSAVPLAAVIENPAQFKNKKVGLILTGGNVDVKTVASYF